MVLFCSVCLPALICRMNIAVPCSLAPELKIRAPHSSVSPQKRAINHSCLPSFHQGSVHPACVELFISGMQLSFKTPNFRDSHSEDQHYTSQGMSPGASAFCWTPPRKAVAGMCGGSKFMATQSRKLAPRLTVFSQLPCSFAWQQART